MCELYLDGEEFDFFDISHIKKSRKVHRCECCMMNIPKGSPYSKTTGLLDGEFEVDKMCEQCFADNEKFSKAHRFAFLDVWSFRDQLEQCILEEPDSEWVKMREALRERILESKQFRDGVSDVFKDPAKASMENQK